MMDWRPPRPIGAVFTDPVGAERIGPDLPLPSSMGADLPPPPFAFALAMGMKTISRLAIAVSIERRVVWVLNMAILMAGALLLAGGFQFQVW